MGQPGAPAGADHIMPLHFDAIDHSALAAALLRPVLQAGAVEMRYYREGVAIESKADNSPVTSADREAEAILLAGLAEAAPGIPVIAEEAVAEGSVPAIGRALFLVDPLDGTREFISQRGEFTVNVALVVDGRPRFGIVYAPALGDLYVTLGTRRCGHAHVAPEAPVQLLADCRFRDIATRRPVPGRLAAVASRSHLTPETEACLARFPVSERRDAGSSLKFCLLARGEADLYPRLGPTMEWDIAAGHAVLEAAGGIVVDLDGKPLVYGKAAEGYRSRHFVAAGQADVLCLTTPKP
jgi:3'(2'), 5'-bisphosphate nucleotidase